MSGMPRDQVECERVVVAPEHRVARVPLEHVVRDGVARGVEDDPINLARARHAHARAGHLIRLDELEVERDWRIDAWVARQDGEGLAALGPAHPHRPQLRRQVHRLRPILERVLDPPVGVGAASEHLEARAGAHAVVGQRQDDAFRVAVVGDLVAGAVAQDPPHLRVDSGVRGQAVRLRPVPAVVGRGLRGVELGADDGHDRSGTRRLRGLGAPGCEQSLQHGHTAPGGSSFTSLTPSPFFRVASLPAR